MNTQLFDGRTSLAEAARKYAYGDHPRATPGDLDALLSLLRATLLGISSAERPLDWPDRRKRL